MAFRSRVRRPGISIRLLSPVIGAAFFSCMMNVLALASPLFMLEVYDRVIPSGSLPTLVALLALVGGLYAVSGFLDIIRGRVLSRIAGIVDTSISSRVLSLIASTSIGAKADGDVLRPAHDMDLVRSFMAGPGPAALFDVPWMPVYLAVCFFLHPLIGGLASGAMIILVALTIATDLLTRSHTKNAALAISDRNRFGEAAHRNAEAIAAMGMLEPASARWSDAHGRFSTLQRKTGDVSGMLAGLSRTLRHMVQSGALALGAYLVILGDMTGGMIVAASIIVARALQPVELVIANWRSMLAARQAWRRLNDAFDLFPGEQQRTALPTPAKSLSVEAIFVAPPGERQRLTIQNISLRAEAGSVIGVVGPSASGKSSLARAITGVWPLARGHVKLDGAHLEQWSASERGKHIGYMPQSSDLFPGTIAENIGRLDEKADHAAIIAAAQAAGIHDMIVALPDGYETHVGDYGVNLSAGQRQRVALARALFGEPFVVVLDEPNSNLDTDGEKALAHAISAVRARGGIVIIVAHRSSILSQLDFLLVMENGLAKAFGPRDAVLASLQQQRPKTQRAMSSPALTVIGNDGAQQ